MASGGFFFGVCLISDKLDNGPVFLWNWRQKMKAKTLWAEQNGRCFYCGFEIEEKDGNVEHLVPKSRKQGTNESENLVFVCSHINKKFGATPLKKKIEQSRKWYLKERCPGKEEVEANTEVRAKSKAKTKKKADLKSRVKPELKKLVIKQKMGKPMAKKVMLNLLASNMGVDRLLLGQCVKELVEKGSLPERFNDRVAWD
jgi:CRISPR/Cas system Type II protein with McrA/HNH and RuvC-like nuclease domain